MVGAQTLIKALIIDEIVKKHMHTYSGIS